MPDHSSSQPLASRQPRALPVPLPPPSPPELKTVSPPLVSQAHNQEQEAYAQRPYAQDSATSGAETPNLRRIAFRMLRLLMSAGILLGCGAWFLRDQQILSSREGFINGSILTVKAPLTGQLKMPSLKSGDAVRSGEVLGEVHRDRNAELERQQQQLQTQLQLAQQQLKNIQQKQSSRRSLLAEVQRQQATQQKALLNYDGDRIAQVQHQLQQAQQSQKAAQREVDRLTGLLDSGVIARQQVEQAGDRLAQANLDVDAAQARLRQVQAEQAASQQGVRLSQAGEHSALELRIQEIKTELADLELELTQAQTQVVQLQREQTQATAQLQQYRTAPVQSPSSGVVWSLDVQGATPVEENEALFQVLDCDNTWVEAFVSERDMGAIAVGAPVRVEILGQDNQALLGRVRSIRAGVGRSQLGQDVALPLPDRSRREVGVQIDILEQGWERYGLNANPAGSPQTVSHPTQPHQALSSEAFCGVGQTVQVTFEPQQDPWQERLAFWRN